MHAPIARAQARIEDVEHCFSTGENLHGTALRLGVTPEALERFLYRYDRGDLVTKLKTETVGRVRRGHHPTDRRQLAA